jgi:hypothetical protein
MLHAKRRGKTGDATGTSSNNPPKPRGDHPDTLTSMAKLASTYRDQGKWEDAEKLQLQVVEASKTKLGANHPDVLTSMTNLAFIYRKQGKHEEAERLDSQVMEAKKGIDGNAC